MGHTEEYPCNPGMCIVAIFVRDIAKCQEVQLHESVASRGVDRKQDGPGDQTSDQADGDADLEIAKEKVSIERLVIEDVGIRYLEKTPQPVE